MARARNLKPGFFKNDELAETGPLGMLLFEGLWTIADRSGRLEDRPLRIKAEVLPYFDADVDDLLSKLAERGFVRRYTGGGKRIIQVENFDKHQTPHPKESASSLPAYDEKDAGHRQDTGKKVANPSDSLRADVLNAESGLLTAESGLLTADSGGDGGADAPAAAAAPPAEPESSRSLSVEARSKPIAIPKPRSAGATPLPADWSPSVEAVDLAVRPPPDGLGLPAGFVASETERFRDYWLGSGGRKADWLATWRGWMRKEAQEGRFAARGSLKPDGADDPMAYFSAMARGEV